ncbi:MAG: ABC transporter ATP-binding protein [Egibacteraceae bacterium]
MTSIIRTRDLACAYGSVRAVDGVDLDVRRGQLLALLGPSGCGKTTMLRLLAGFERPDAGTVEIEGRTVAGEGVWVPPERRRVGMVFQDYALFPHLTVERNVAYGLHDRPPPEAARRVASVLELVGLQGLERRYSHQLSGGQQQRVALARALAPRPAVILLDEPFSNLDAARRAQVRADVKRILAYTATTAVFVTHDQEEAFAIADEVAVMRDGRIAQRANPEELYRAPADRDVAGFVGDADFLPGQSLGNHVETELGRLQLAHPCNGPVEVVVRPEIVRLTKSDNGRATVLDREFYGHDQMLVLQLETGRVVRARLGPSGNFQPGDRCDVWIDGAVHAYPANGHPSGIQAPNLGQEQPEMGVDEQSDSPPGANGPNGTFRRL